MTRNGFTLVELLIVIGIIGSLSLFALGAYVQVQRSGRDSQRIADIKKIRIALQAYYTQNGQYPGPVSGYGESDCSGWDTSFRDGDNDGNSFIDPLVEAGILPKVPVDPINNRGTNCSGHGSSGPNYFYHRYNPGTYGCSPNKHYVVFGVGDMETSNGAHSESPGFTCATRDWHGTLEYAIGLYE